MVAKLAVARITNQANDLFGVISKLDFLGDIIGVPLQTLDGVKADLYICKPGAIVPKHRHPRTRATIIYLFGEIQFKVGDKEYNLKPKHVGLNLMIPEGEFHESITGSTGSAFISVSQGLDSTTRAVEDWEGETLGGEHNSIKH